VTERRYIAFQWHRTICMNKNKIIHLKPPIIVRELAKLIEIQPFQLIHDLMDMNVFATSNQTIKPEVAAAICEKYGYTLVVT